MNRIAGSTTKWTIALLCFLAVAAYTVLTWASTPVGVTATLIGRGTFERFKVKTDLKPPLIIWRRQSRLSTSWCEPPIMRPELPRDGIHIPARCSSPSLKAKSLSTRLMTRPAHRQWLRRVKGMLTPATDTSAATRRGTRPRMLPW